MAIELFSDGESGESIRTKINANFVNLDDRLTAREEIDLPALLGLLAPPIVSQPSGGMVAAGSTRTLSVTTGPQVGQAPTTFQWQTLSGSEWSDIAGATSGTYTTPALSDDVTLRVKLSNAFGDTYSTIVTVSVLGFAVQPQSGDFYVGNNVTFTATSNLSGASYRWQEWDGDAWQNITGATSGTYSVNALALGDDAREFRCVISINGVQAISNTATITVFGITTQPTEEVTLEGTADTYSVVVNQSTATYQWQRSTDGGTTWSDLAAETDSSLAVSGTQANNGRKYRCISSFRGLSVTSNVVTRHVLYVSTQPSSTEVFEGQTATFSVASSVTGSSYQWRRSNDSGTTWSDISGATAVPLTIDSTNRTADNGARIACVLSAGGVSVTSDYATLSVWHPVALTGIYASFDSRKLVFTERSSPVTGALIADPVGTWQARYPVSTAMQAIADAGRATLAQKGLNLDGVDDYYRTQNTVLCDYLRNQSEVWLWFVAAKSTSATQSVFSWAAEANGANRLTVDTTTLGTIQVIARSVDGSSQATVTVASLSGVTNGALFDCGIRINYVTGKAQAVINGVTQTEVSFGVVSANVSNTASVYFSLGASFNGTPTTGGAKLFGGLIGDLHLFRGSMTTDGITKMHNYLDLRK